MSENGNGYVKWTVFAFIIAILISCIGTMFATQVKDRQAFNDYKLEMKDDLLEIKLGILELQKDLGWLEEYAPETHPLNPYGDLQESDMPISRDDLINILTKK